MFFISFSFKIIQLVLRLEVEVFFLPKNTSRVVFFVFGNSAQTPSAGKDPGSEVLVSCYATRIIIAKGGLNFIFFDVERAARKGSWLDILVMNWCFAFRSVDGWC